MQNYHYSPRFLTKEQFRELNEYWRMIAPGHSLYSCDRYTRMINVCKAYVKNNPEVSFNQAYKDLSASFE